MKKEIEADVVYCTEGCEVESVKITFTDEQIENVKKAKDLLSKKENSFIDNIDISGWQADVKIFRGILEDKEREEIKYEDWDYFKHDVAKIMVSQHGMYFRAYNKWDSSCFYEIVIE